MAEAATVIDAIEAAGVAILTPLAATLLEVKPLVTLRRRAQVVFGEPPAVVVIDCEESDGFEPATADDGFAYYGRYELTVALQRQNAGRVVAGVDETRAWRQAVRKAVNLLSLRAAGATAVDDCDPLPNESFDAVGLNVNWDVIVNRFDIRTKESR